MKTLIVSKHEAIIYRESAEPFVLYSSDGDIVTLIHEFFSPRSEADCLTLAKTSTEDTQIIELKEAI